MTQRRGPKFDKKNNQGSVDEKIVKQNRINGKSGE